MLRWQTATAAALAVAVLATGVSLVAETRSIERDVAARVSRALGDEATSWAAVEVSGRDVSIFGSAPDQSLLDLAADRAARVSGVRAVDLGAAALLPEEKPYVVTLTRGDDTVLVGGLAPSEPEKRRMLAAVEEALPGLSTADALTLARGMPDEAYLDALKQLYPLAADLANGRVMLKDRTASVDGEAKSNAAFDKLANLHLALPQGYTLAPPLVVRPVASPYRLTAVREKGRVTLSGFAPNPQARADLVAMAEAGGTTSVANEIDLASGDPAGFTPAAVAALDFLDLFASARIDIVGDRISLSGVAASPEAYRTLNSHIATFQPDNFSVEASVDLPVVKPFALTATKAGPKVTVTGFAPSPSAVEDIRRAAEQVAGPGDALVEATLANGAPRDFAAAAAFAVRLLEHLADGSVVLADTKITLSGKAASSGDLLEIDASVALETPDGYTVEVSVQPPLVTPYTWSIERTEDSMVLSGFVPSENARVAVRDAADDAAGDLAVTDRTALALGLPEGIDLAAVASFAASEIGKLDEGRIDLVDRKLSIRGRTADALAGRSVQEAFADSLPAGTEKGTVEIDAPAPMQARIERSADGLTVEGTIPEQAADDRIVALVGRLFGDLDVEIRLTPVGGLPNGAEAALGEALRAAALMSAGTVVIDDTSVRIEGTALTAPAVELIDTATVAAMPAGFVTRTSVVPPPEPDKLDAKACDEGLGRILERSRLTFADDGKSLAEDSIPAAHELAAEAIACAPARILVEVGPPGGAPATDGPAALHAAAVRDELIRAGLPADRVDARGLAATGTPDGTDLPVRIRSAPPSPSAGNP